MPRMPRPPGPADGRASHRRSHGGTHSRWTFDRGADSRRARSRWANARWACSRGTSLWRTCDRRTDPRWARFRRTHPWWARPRRTFDRRAGDRWLNADRRPSRSVTRSGRSSRPRGQLSGHGRRRTNTARSRAGQLGDSRLEPVGHRGPPSGTDPDRVLDPAAIDARASAYPWRRGTCGRAGTGARRRTRPGRRTARRGRSAYRRSLADGRATRRRRPAHRRRSIDGRTSASTAAMPPTSASSLSKGLAGRHRQGQNQNGRKQHVSFHGDTSFSPCWDPVSSTFWRTTVTSGILGNNSPATSRSIDCHRSVSGST